MNAISEGGYPRGEDISPGGHPQVMTRAEVLPDVVAYPLPLDHRPLEPPGVGPRALGAPRSRVHGFGQREPIYVDVVALPTPSGSGSATSPRGRERSAGHRLRCARGLFASHFASFPSCMPSR